MIHSQIKALILAAGIGKRLRPLTNDLPKCLVDIEGLPILHYQLEALSRSNIFSIAIVVGYKSEKIISYVKDHFPNLAVSYINNDFFDSTNTLYSFALGMEYLKNESIILQMNADVVFDSRVIDLLIKKDPVESFVALRRDRCSEEEIKVTVDDRGYILELNKQVPIRKAIGEGVGINIFSGDFLNLLKSSLVRIKESNKNDYFELAIEDVIKNGGKIRPLDVGDLEVTEIDFPKDLDIAREFQFVKNFRENLEYTKKR